MSFKLVGKKPRTIRNSQRLFNLQQQEELYCKLGVTAMSGEKETPKEENLQEDLSSHDEEGQGGESSQVNCP